mgnify:CR=1 FL=1
MATPRLRIVSLLAVVLLVTAACGSADPYADDSIYAGVELAVPAEKPDFVLTDTNGDRFDFRAETDGKLTLLYFGYTFCPDICPVHLAQLDAVFERLPEVARNAKVVFVTVDPERDTPEQLRSWLDAFNPDFVGLTGTDAELITAQEEAGVPLARKNDDGPNYTVGHAGQVLAYAPDGLGYTVYPFGTRQSEWVQDLPLLLELTD